MKLRLALLSAILAATGAHASGNHDRIIEVRAHTAPERTRLGELGYALDEVRSDRLTIIGDDADLARIRAAGYEAESFAMPTRFDAFAAASAYHSYDTLMTDLRSLTERFPRLATLSSMGRSVQRRDMPLLRISGKTPAQAEADHTPVAFYMGCHHAREHLSVEVPYLFAKYLLEHYGTDPSVTRLVDSREIYVAPMINPDGHAYDYTGRERGRMWRKNRSINPDGTFGVDLNRNYGFHWGTGGSSSTTSDDTYMGPSAFSEPETRAVRDFVDSQPRMTTLLTLHSFSELVLYPWGHTEDKIGENGLGTAEDLRIYETMAQTISQWNHYTPEQSSSLYIASGDTTDWSYGAHGIISFTFELSPNSMWNGGFYPGNEAIAPAFADNVKPMMYLLEYADNPKRVLTERPPGFLSTPSSRGLPIADVRDAF